MVDIFLERRFDSPVTAEEFLSDAAQAAGCFDLYRVDWQLSMLGADGQNCVCWFSGTDAESVRLAMRTNGVDASAAWSGTIHDAPGRSDDEIAGANVIVTRRFDTPVTLDEIQAIEDGGAHCLEMRRVTFMRTFFSLDRRRMLCLYDAPDAESVREAQREAGMPVDAVWPFQRLDQTSASSVDGSPLHQSRKYNDG
jgi:hypothetical protein